MPALVARSVKPTDSWELPLLDNGPFALGRTAGPLPVTWDPYVSRHHAELLWQAGKLRVRRSPNSANPIFWHGEEAPAEFLVEPGDFFVIGQTRFLVCPDVDPDHTNAVVAGRTFGAAELAQLPFREGPERLDLLNQLPEVIAGAADDREMFGRLAGLLLAGVPRAEAVAFVRLDPERAGAEPEVLFTDQGRDAKGSFQPSRSLVIEALVREKASSSRIWGRGFEDGTAVTTGAAQFDWAFCSPVRGEACPGWGIYVAGSFQTGPAHHTVRDLNEEILRYDVKFTELVAAILNALRQAQKLQQRQASLGQFFSRGVLEQVLGRGPEQGLQPSEARIAVLFGDLRGFSGLVERGDLLASLEGVSAALGVMTEHIIKQNGVIGDFHGDAVMGFWGWPKGQTDPEARACQAALDIRDYFAEVAANPQHQLAGFRVGLGIATGRAVAGAIGTSDQLKVTAFGPVVNLASRLEGMTKIPKAPVLLDEETARAVHGRPPFRVRRLARVVPYGLRIPLQVYELLPRQDRDSILSDDDVRLYEQAVDDFQAGRWPAAAEKLHQVPAGDRAKYFLMRQVLGEEPPPDWDAGSAIVLDRKS